MDLICLGELLIDMFPAELGRPHAEVSAFRPVPGGAPANAAVAARRLGAQAAFIGKVGDDPFGHFLVDVLAREGVETRGMRLDPEARTTMNLMAQPDANHYDCLFYRNPGADTRLRPDELDVELLRTTRAFHFGSLSLTDEPARSATLDAVKIAKAGGALISYDVNYRPTLWKSPEEAAAQARAMIRYADLVKVNEAELALLAGEGDITVTSGALLDMGPSLCVVTLGPMAATSGWPRAARLCRVSRWKRLTPQAAETRSSPGCCGSLSRPATGAASSRPIGWPRRCATPTLSAH